MDSPWTFEGSNFPTAPEDMIGFVYLITNNVTGKKYVGKKLFWSKVTKPPLKGQKRKRRSLKESDWKTYLSSSDELKRQIEEYGIDNFSREIIKLCADRGVLSYYEAKYQFDNDVLMKPDEYINGIIQCRIHRKHVYNK